MPRPQSPPPAGRLAGKVAVIGGAGSAGPGWGNGRAAAVLFAREGATVLLTDRDKDALEVTADQVRAEGGTVRTDLLDVTEPDAVQAYFTGAAARAPRLHIHVNNAGGAPPRGAAQHGVDERESPLRHTHTSADRP
ncbi:SDR family NAD(P)-dependent oxidoreductase, partial [Streptomyces sp. NPDC059627]